MDNGVVKYNTDAGEIELSPATIKKYLVSGNGNVTDQEIIMFLNLCRYQKLNPFLREAYLIKFGTSPATIVTGKEVFTKRAAKKPEYDGADAGIIIHKGDEVIYRPGTMLANTETLIGGWAEVYRKDWKRPVRSEVSLTEYKRFKADGSPMPNWKSMPATMIRKVALVQALREAFPEDLGGMYSQEEMPVDDSNLESKPVKFTPLTAQIGTVSKREETTESINVTPVNVSQIKGEEIYNCIKCGIEIKNKKVYEYKGLGLCIKCQKEIK